MSTPKYFCGPMETPTAPTASCVTGEDCKTENEKRFAEIVKGMSDLYAKKNRDYGDSYNLLLNDLTAKVYPAEIVFYIRAMDKINRIISLASKDPAVKDEKVRDTVIDLANYSVMFAMWLDGRADSARSNEDCEAYQQPLYTYRDRNGELHEGYPCQEWGQ